MKLKLKGCPRCKGALILDKDRHGWYEQCLQCGHLRDIAARVEIVEPSDKCCEVVMTGATAHQLRGSEYLSSQKVIR